MKSPARPGRPGTPVLGRPSPWWVGWRLSVVLLAVVMAVGTAGFVVIEGWGVFDAFYMTLTTVTTVGYGEIHPLSRAGRVFNIGVVVFGVATVLYTFSFLMARLVEGDLPERWARRRRERMLDELSHHFIICGFGRIGQIIAEEFTRQSVPFVIVERDGGRMQEAIDLGYLAVEADASSELVLKRIGIDRARGFIAAVSTDAENVYAVLTARLLGPSLFILGRAETEDAKAKLLRAGCDRVLSPYQIGGLQLAQTALRPAVVDFVQLATSSDNMDLNMEQVQIAAGSELAGKTILQAGLRQRFGVVVIGVQRASGAMEFNPSPEIVMQVGDFLVVLGRATNLHELESVAAAPAAGRVTA